MLQPSPRPPWYVTMTPTGGPTATPTPTRLPPPPTPTPTPTAVLLPVAGDTFQAGWLLGLGIGCILLGLALAVLGRGTAGLHIGAAAPHGRDRKR